MNKPRWTVEILTRDFKTRVLARATVDTRAQARDTARRTCASYQLGTCFPVFARISRAPDVRIVDFAVEHHGSITLVRPRTGTARAWLEQNGLHRADTQWWAGALVVAPRYLDNLVAGITSDGLVVA